MILLSVQNCRKQYGPEPVLVDITFDIRPGERVSLVGTNGAGKSTLMRILVRQEEPDAGQLAVHGSSRIGYLEQHPTFEPERTVWQEASDALGDLISLGRQAEQVAKAIAESTDPEEQRRLGIRYDHLQHELQHHDAYNVHYRIERVLEGLGFSSAQHDQPVRQLSGGQQNRLILARLLLSEPDLMLLDEPSNHLDIEATQWLESYLVESEQTLLVVSHDRYFLDRVTNRTLELHAGTIDSYSGNFSAYRRQKAERLEVQRRTFDRQQIEIAKIEDFIRRNHYGQKHLQAEDRRKKLERLERVAPPREIVAPAMAFPPASRTGDIVLRVEHLSKRFERPLFHDLSFDILRGEKWGIVGPNGSGKTTLLRCVLGLLPADEGRSMLGAGVKVGYFDQHLMCVADATQVADAIRPDHKEFTIQQRRDLLARFGLVGDMAFQSVGSLSGGERNRTALAWLAASDANFLILDEPTNHLDLWARAALESALRAFDGSVLLVSHDRYFLNQVCDHLLVVEPDRFRVIEGNYDAYQFHCKQRSSGNPAADTGRAGQAQVESGSSRGESRKGGDGANKSAKPRRQRKFPYRKALEIEQEIQRREQRIEQLHQELADPDILRDGALTRQLKAELEEQHSCLPALYEHWEEAVEFNT
ncbi:MAG: ABC-F family ATP-binding cassette domain-containing protein [Planctomycetes bacterium]|nr:ABC-F family ATP-binding cassette domain-containing protein [Planctomycetota bacterium]